MKKNPVLLTAGIVVLSMAASTAAFAGDAENAEVAVEATEAAEASTYVVMNIPYGEFYANEYEGGDAIDSVSSATMNKPSREGLTGGSYHLEDNSKILGISYPVAVPEGVTLDESLKVAAVENLYAAADYSYCELVEAPSYYKVLTVNEDGSYSFSKSEGEVEEITSSVTLEDQSVWSDFVLVLDEGLVGEESYVYGAILHTAEGDSYGMRTLENIWRGYEIGFTTTSYFKDVHESELSYEPYEGLMGQTIDQITLYTSEGIKSISTSVFVPYKFENTIEVAAADITAGETTVTFTGFPEDYDAEYSIEGSSELTCDGFKITWENAFAGTYTLNITDASGKYASYSQEFILSTTDEIAVAGEDALVAAEGVSDEAFAAYIANITDFDANGTNYSSSGHHGTQIVLEDGSIDKTENSVFSEVGEYELIIRAAGYTDVALSVTIDEVAESEESEGGQGHGEGVQGGQH
jgi:hypothetical protein